MGGGTGKKAKEENEGQEPPSCEVIPHFPFFWSRRRVGLLPNGLPVGQCGVLYVCSIG